MSVYNGGEYLDESIQSILNQTFKDFEFIIVLDNPNNKKIEKIIKKYLKRDKRIILIKNKNNIGLTKSLNIGIKQAKGKYIARQDADDISLPERLENQFNFLEKNKDIFLCGTNCSIIDETGKYLMKRLKLVVGYKNIKKELPKHNCFIHTSIMFRNKNIFYREKFKYIQDYDLYLNMLTRGFKLENLNKVLVQYRHNIDGLGYSKQPKQILFIKKAREFYKQRLKNENDGYDDWNPQSILDIKDSIAQSVFLKERITVLLKNGDYKKAKKYLYKCRGLREVTLIKYITYYVYIHFYVVYKFYRRIFYNDNV